MSAVQAKRVESVDVEGMPPGAFEYFSAEGRDIAGMIFVCPCGCGDHCALDFRPHESPSWDWDGNMDAPTLSPSVHRLVTPRGQPPKTHWHGWLRAGVWESC